MPNPVPSLRIAVLGAGKIGSAFAFHLARTGGHDVTVVARPDSARLQQLERDRAIVDVKGERAGVQVASRLDEAVPYDLVIVTLLAHQADALLPALQRSAAMAIQFMFNTFDPERLRVAIGDERCSFGMPFVQANLTGDGRLDAKVGAGGQKTIMGRQRWVDLFNAAGLPAALERDMPRWLRCHVPLCVAFESVSVAGERRGGGASWGQALVVSRGLRASFALDPGARIRSLPEDEEAHPTQSDMGGGGHALVAVARPTLPKAAGDGRSRMPFPGRGYGDGRAAREVAGRRRGCSGYGADGLDAGEERGLFSSGRLAAHWPISPGLPIARHPPGSPARWYRGWPAVPPAKSRTRRWVGRAIDPIQQGELGYKTTADRRGCAVHRRHRRRPRRQDDIPVHA